jgi:hypothetical protein
VVRGFLAVVAGFAAWSVLWFAGNSAIQAGLAGRFNSDLSTDDVLVCALLILVSVACSLLAGYVTAWVAKKRWLAFAWVQALVLLAVGLVVEIGIWQMLPAWYHIVFLVLLVPATLVGAHLRQRGRAPVSP